MGILSQISKVENSSPHHCPAAASGRCPRSLGFQPGDCNYGTLNPGRMPRPRKLFEFSGWAQFGSTYFGESITEFDANFIS